MKIIVDSVGGAHNFINKKEFNDNDRFAVITVTQSKVHFEYPSNLIDHLIIPVDDIDDDFVKNHPVSAKSCGPLFDTAFAEEIKVFVELNKDKVDYFLIHCDAGVSRSRAVAAALEFVHNGNDGEHFEKGVPNRTIYKVMLKAYGFSNDYTEVESPICWVCGRNWSLESGRWNSNLGTGRTWHIECDADYELLIQEEKYMSIKEK